MAQAKGAGMLTKLKSCPTGRIGHCYRGFLSKLIDDMYRITRFVMVLTGVAAISGLLFGPCAFHTLLPLHWNAYSICRL